MHKGKNGKCHGGGRGNSSSLAKQKWFGEAGESMEEKNETLEEKPGLVENWELCGDP